VRAAVRHSRLHHDAAAADDGDPALWLAREGRLADAFALTWRVLASDSQEGVDRALRLLGQCEPRTAFAALSLPQARSLVRLMVAELQDERHVDALLPWLERALWLQHEGLQVFDEREWETARRAVRGLSASDDAVGVAAATLHAFFHTAAKMESELGLGRPEWQQTHSWLG
jgi:hypothetical protein